MNNNDLKCKCGSTDILAERSIWYNQKGEPADSYDTGNFYCVDCGEEFKQEEETKNNNN